LNQTGVVVPAQDPQLIYRLVGFIEYGIAINHLDEFVESASSAELEIADAIVRRRPQFDVRINLSRHLAGQSLFNRPPERSDHWTRRGLAWVMALARVELGAMLAGFSSVPRPFHMASPTMFETEAYREILTDGLRVHYWSLKRDPAIGDYARTGVPEQHIITYGRRAGVARRFLEASGEFSRRQLSAGQQAELNAWERDFRRLELVLLYCLSQKISASGSRSEITQEFWNCPGLCQAAAREVGLDVSDKRSERSLSSFSFRLSDLLASIDPTLLAVPCQHTPIQQQPLGGPRRRR
jgi:hypothetical protein